MLPTVQTLIIDVKLRNKDDKKIYDAAKENEISRYKMNRFYIFIGPEISNSSYYILTIS